jgi:hypothetical protein
MPVLVSANDYSIKLAGGCLNRRDNIRYPVNGTIAADPFAYFVLSRI